MDGKVLVTYGTKYGATAEIAERIGATLRQAGLAVDVTPAGRAGDLAPYRAVVLGSAVYMGQWRKEAAGFLKAHAQALSGLPVWIFSSGPSGKGDPAELLKGWRLPPGLQPVADTIHPRDVAVFGGAVDAAKMNAFERWIMKRVKAPTGDYRNWEAITAWAEGIADALKPPAA